MAEHSKISWTHSTFNPWVGCAKVHDGCTKCYAEAFAKRTNKAQWGPNGTRVKTSPKYWSEPLKWNRAAQCHCGPRYGDRQCEWCRNGNRRPRVFCASLADVFEDWQGPILHHGGDQLFWYEGEMVPRKSAGVLTVPVTMDDVRRALFELIDKTPNLDWLLLTKRPENIPRMWPKSWPHGSPRTADEKPVAVRRDNVWLGTSISNQATADEMVPRLQACRDLVPVLFLSAEPLLGPIDLTRSGYDGRYITNPLSGETPYRDDRPPVSRIDQVIFGVESRGKFMGRLGAFESAEAFNQSVAEGVIQCKHAGVAAFVKQIPLGGLVSHDPSEWPEVLRVQEFPKVAHEVPVLNSR